jgi:hypothetical protein
MRFLLAAILLLPALAQEPAAKPEAQAKPEEKAKPEAQSKPEEKAAPAAAEEQKAASPVPSAEEWLSGSIDFGYRWIPGVAGNQDVYRSVVNLGEGPKLLGADFTIQDPKRRLFDRVDARANAWGGDPYNTAHVDARKQGVYDFRFDYRNIAYFNSLPSFANPNLLQGIYLGEHRFDTHRRMSSFDLDLMPGKRIIPYFAYSRDGGRGRGVTTYVSDGNEYAVPDILSDHTDNYRGGLRFEFNRWHLTLEEGATRYSDDQQVYETQGNPGNRTTLLGTQPLNLSRLNQLYGITADGLYSKVLFTASPVSWANIYGQFLYSQPKTTVQYNDSVAGNLAVLSSLLFYTGQQDQASGTAKAPHTAASIGFELRPFQRLRVVESLSTDRTHNAGFGLLAETLLLGGGSQALPNVALNDRLVLNYNRQQVDLFFDLLPRLTLRGGYRFVWGDASVRAGQLSQIGGLESGEVRQQVGLAGLTFRTTQKLSFNVDYEGASSSRAYFRTSLYDYHRARLRARYQALGSLAFQASASVFSNQNPSPQVNFDALSRYTSLTAFWTPGGGKRFSITADYMRSTLRSDIFYRTPSQLNLLAPSFYRDNAHTATTLVDLALPGYGGLTPKLSVGGSLYISSGSRPTHYYQPLGRLSLPLHKNVYWNTEWRWFGYGEEFYTFEGFRAHVIMTGLRLVR